MTVSTSLPQPTHCNLMTDEWLDYFADYIKTTGMTKIELTPNYKMSASVSFLFSMCEFLEEVPNIKIKIDIKRLYGIPLTFDVEKTLIILSELKQLFKLIYTILVKNGEHSRVALYKSGSNYPSAFEVILTEDNLQEEIPAIDTLFTQCQYLTQWKKSVSFMNTKYLRGNTHWWATFTQKSFDH